MITHQAILIKLIVGRINLFGFTVNKKMINMDLFMNFLKKLRKDLHKTQHEFAEEIHIPIATYQRYERGERDIPYKIAKKLSHKFGFNVNLIYQQNDLGSNIANKNPEKLDDQFSFTKEDKRDMKNAVKEAIFRLGIEEHKGSLKGFVNGFIEVYAQNNGISFDQADRRFKDILYDIMVEN